MTKFHITGKGDAGVCKAEVRGCPLGGEADHYNTAEEARSAFEASQSTALSTTMRKQTPAEKVGEQFEEEAPSGSVYLTDAQDKAFEEWLEDSDKWEKDRWGQKEGEYEDYIDEEVTAEVEELQAAGEWDDHDDDPVFDRRGILDEVRTRVAFYTDDTYRTSHGESFYMYRKDIDGFEFAELMKKHRVIEPVWPKAYVG